MSIFKKYPDDFQEIVSNIWVDLPSPYAKKKFCTLPELQLQLPNVSIYIIIYYLTDFRICLVAEITVNIHFYIHLFKKLDRELTQLLTNKCR